MTFVIAVHTGAGNRPNEKKVDKYDKLVRRALEVGLSKFKEGSNATDAVAAAISCLG